jgi:hypothetical protein
MVARKNRTNKTTQRIKASHKEKSLDFLSHSYTDTNDEKGNRPAEDSVQNVFRKKRRTSKNRVMLLYKCSKQ